MSFVILFLQVLIQVMSIALILRVVWSWLSPSMHANVAGRLLHEMTEPVLNIVRKVPHQIGMIDLSPVIALFALDLVGTLLISLLSQIPL